MESPIAEIRKTIIVIHIFMFYSCAPNMYMPNMQNIPAFTKKNQMNINYSWLSPGGHDIQAAYSVTNNLAVMVNSAFYNNDGATGLLKAPTHSSAIELGIGYFKSKNKFVFEIYLLFANGNVSNGQGFFNSKPISPFGNFNSKIFRVANQTSLTYKRKIFEFSLSNRFSFLNYYNIGKEPYFYNEVDMREYISSSPNFVFVEPAMTVKIGLKNFKLLLQLQRSFSLKSIPSSNHYQYYEGVGFFGATIGF